MKTPSSRLSWKGKYLEYLKSKFGSLIMVLIENPPSRISEKTDLKSEILSIFLASLDGKPVQNEKKFLAVVFLLASLTLFLSLFSALPMLYLRK